MTVCGIKTRFDHLETANMTGVKNDLSVMDGTDLNAGAGGGLRHGWKRRGGTEGRRRGKEIIPEHFKPLRSYENH